MNAITRPDSPPTARTRRRVDAPASSRRRVDAPASSKVVDDRLQLALRTPAALSVRACLRRVI